MNWRHSFWKTARHRRRQLSSCFPATRVSGWTGRWRKQWTTTPASARPRTSRKASAPFWRNANPSGRANDGRSSMNARAAGETTFRVRYAETDQMGVVYHSNFVIWFEVGRVELMRQLGFRYRDMEQQDGCHIPVADLHVRYKE